MSSPDSELSVGGVLPVFQTPYHEDETIDFATLEREIDWLFERGSDGIVMAMVSEVLRLSSEERDELAKRACRASAGRGTSVISVGAESTAVSVRHACHAQDVGADAVMAIPPVALALPESELFAYYSRLIEAIEIPVIVQDASGYVGRPMSIEMQANLLREFGPERVMYKPEAEPIGPRLTELHEATGGQAAVFEGTGGIALVDSYRRGVTGTIPGADLIQALVPLWRALETGDEAKACAIHEPLADLVGLQKSLDAFLAVEKHLLVRQGIFKSEIVRGPVGFRLTDELRARVDAAFDRLLEAAG
jgi:dihydrodipicolinate synthase/N-acetylneuraminate lyase